MKISIISYVQCNISSLVCAVVSSNMEVKMSACNNEIFRSHPKRKSDLELEDDEKPSKIPSK